MSGRAPTIPPLKRLARPRTGTLPPLRITQTHLDMLAAVAHARFLSSDQISRKVGGSHQKNLRRLYKLWRHGLLDRPAKQHVELAAFFDGGNRPLVYGLGRRGARLLSERGIGINHKLDWTTKNTRATPPFFAHTMDVADIMHAADADVRNRPGCRLIEHHQLIATFPERTQALREPFLLRVTIMRDGKRVPIPVVPDRLFQILYPDMPGHAFALERDRGTMSIGNENTSLFKSSIWRKLLGYWHAVQSKQHTSVWGFQSFRILCVTTSEARIANMIVAERDATQAPAGLFLYSTLDRIAEHGFLGPAWVSANRSNVSLARSHLAPAIPLLEAASDLSPTLTQVLGPSLLTTE